MIGYKAQLIQTCIAANDPRNDANERAAYRSAFFFLCRQVTMDPVSAEMKILKFVEKELRTDVGA